MPTELYLIRHGQAFSNVTPTLAGPKGDEGLTEIGVRQAEHLRDRLAATREIKPDLVIASTLPRAARTAQIIAPALGLPIIWDEEFQELRPGDEADGMTVEEATARFGELDFTNNPFGTFFGGENWGQFLLRVGTALDRVCREHNGKTMVIVCHGGVIDASLIHFGRLSTTHMPPLAFYTMNTSITHWQIRTPRRSTTAPSKWTLMKYNDDMHTRDLDTAERINWSALAPRPVADRPPASLPTEESQAEQQQDQASNDNSL